MLEKTLAKDAKIMIIFKCIKAAIDVLLGPFLISYFIKLSNDNIKYISITNIAHFIAIMVGFYLLGYFIKKINKMNTFRIGILLQLV